MKKGLTNQQVEENKKKYGTNVIIEADPETLLDKVKAQLLDPMMTLLLIIAGIFTVLALLKLEAWTDSIGLIGIVTLVVFVAARTEMASDNAYRKLQGTIKKDTCKVYRDGKIVEIDMDDVVVGDSIILQSGDKIPADGTLVEGFIKVDNSSLNGESEECKKTANLEAGSIKAEDWNADLTGDTFVDAHSIFRGSVVVDGSGIMSVIRVGMNTVMGKMAEDMAGEEVDGPLKVKLSDLAHKISVFGYIGAFVIAMALLFFDIKGMGGFEQYFQQDGVLILKHVLDIFLKAIVIVVMAVPEGLPLMIAIVLRKNTNTLYSAQVLVRKPIGIETAGSLNILFSDKTGTITRGQLEVVEFFDGAIQDTQADADIQEKMNLCIGRNTAAMFGENGTILGGNATDKALLAYLTKERSDLVREVTVEADQQFNSKNKYSSAQINGKTYYKGAPDRLIAKATKCLTADGRLVDVDKDAINQKISELAQKSMRVLGFAYSGSALVEDNLNDDLILVGFVGIRDDVRPEARQAILEVQQAGVQVVMITGDYKETAVAIAKDCGLIQSATDTVLTSVELNQMSDQEIKAIPDSTAVVLTSLELKEMSDEKIKAILPKIRVISRAMPTDKSRMVRLAQELNLVCGMTGDGVNDAPALKRADVGFAMGKTGTDVAKSVADIVILDDNFKSIENAILYGRTIYNNIQKFIKFQLTINVAAVAICTIAPFLGMEQPLGVTQILWVNLIMDALGALALGAEPALKSYMKEKPKSRTESIVSKKMMSQILVAGTYITVLGLVFLMSPFFKEFFGTKEVHLTAYFSLFVLFAVFNSFNIRSENFNLFIHMEQNKGFIKVMGTIVLVQIALTFIGGAVFNCTPMELKHWLMVIVLAFTIIPIDLLRKAIVNRK